MIDTIVIRFNMSDYLDINRYHLDLNKVISALIRAGGEIKKLPNGSKKIDALGIELRVYKQHFKMDLSLWKFCKGNSGKPFEVFEVRGAIKLLSQKLGIIVEKGLLTRVDIAQNFETEYKVAEYLRVISKPNQFRVLFDHPDESIAFANKTNNQQSVFYDKIEQLDSKEKIVREDWPENILRYEYRIASDVSQVINLNKKRGHDKVRVIHLYSSGFLHNLLNRWFENFFKINWIGSPTAESISGMRDFKDFFVAKCVLDNGGVGSWCRIIESFQNKEGDLWSASAKSKARNYLRSVTTNDKLIKPSPYAIEIKRKVIDCFLALKRHQKSAI